MNIVLLGCNGQVGWELQRSLAPLGTVVALSRHGIATPLTPDLIATNPINTCRSPVFEHPRTAPSTASQTALNALPTILYGDLAQPDALAATVRALQPDVIVNAAAYTAVDQAESQPELARTINALAPEALAREAAACGALLVHYSSDYVFDGSGSAAWREADATGPLNIYGATKLEGEQRIAASGCRHLIFRTSWVYAARGANFAKTMLRLARERDTLTVINDQFGAPTGAELIADVTAHAIRHAHPAPAAPATHRAPETTPRAAALSGIYHLAASGTTTWHDYAKEVLRQVNTDAFAIKNIESDVRPVPSSAFPTAARRPLNSRLDTTRLQTTFGLTLPPWQHGVRRMLAEIVGV